MYFLLTYGKKINILAVVLRSQINITSGLYLQNGVEKWTKKYRSISF